MATLDDKVQHITSHQPATTTHKKGRISRARTKDVIVWLAGMLWSILEDSIAGDSSSSPNAFNLSADSNRPLQLPAFDRFFAVDSHEDIACVYVCTSGKTTHTSSMTTTLPIFFSRLVHGMLVRPLVSRRSAMRLVFLRKMTFRSHPLSLLRDINVNGRRIFMLCQYPLLAGREATSDHLLPLPNKRAKKKTNLLGNIFSTKLSTRPTKAVSRTHNLWILFMLGFGEVNRRQSLVSNWAKPPVFLKLSGIWFCYDPLVWKWRIWWFVLIPDSYKVLTTKHLWPAIMKHETGGSTRYFGRPPQQLRFRYFAQAREAQESGQWFQCLSRSLGEADLIFWRIAKDEQIQGLEMNEL